MVISHIQDFLKVKGETAGLGFWCEQAFESCHHDFKVPSLNGFDLYIYLS